MNVTFFKPKRSFKEWKRRDQCLFVAIILLLLFHFAIGSGIINSPFYVNVSSSAPMGVYVISNDQKLVPDAYVMVKENHRLEPFYGKKTPPRFLLKHIAGLPGDLMTVHDKAVIIRDAIYPTLGTTSTGVPLQQLKVGTYVLQDDEYFVANSPERSYDSRYFGPVTKNEIQAVVTPIWIFGEGVTEFVTQWQALSNR